jgi:hypothetical protein
MAIAFPAVLGALPSEPTISESVTLDAIEDGTAISVDGCEYRINAGEWTEAAGTVDTADEVELRMTSSATLGATETGTLTVGEDAIEWTVPTRTAVRWKFDPMAVAAALAAMGRRRQSGGK